MRERPPDRERGRVVAARGRVEGRGHLLGDRRRLGSAGRAGEPVKPAHRQPPRSSAPRLADEGRLVLEAAQVEDQRAVGDAADHRHRQRRGARRRARASARRRACAAPAGSRARRSARVSSGSAPEPIWLAQATDLDREAGAERRRDEPAARRSRQRLDLGCRAREQPQRRQPLGQPVGIAIEPQRRLQRGEPDLVEPQRPLHRVAVDARRSRSLRPTMKPACGPPSSLSPEKVTRSAPSATASATVGSCAQAQAREIDERAGAEIVDERHAVLVRERGKLARARPPR